MRSAMEKLTRFNGVKRATRTRIRRCLPHIRATCRCADLDPDPCLRFLGKADRRSIAKTTLAETADREKLDPIGREHPEFFRVFDPQGDSRQNESVTLVAQFVLPTVQKYDGAEAQTPALSAEVTNNLMNLAIELHDREMQRRDRWKIVLVPMIVAIVAAGATVTAAIITSSRHTADQQRITPLRPPDEHAA
jgi:hypothetical protein